MKHIKPLKINESNSNNQELIEEIQEVQEKLREAVSSLKSIQRRTDRITSERIYRYILGYLEPLIDDEHSWLGRNTSLKDIIEDLKGYEEEPETDESIRYPGDPVQHVSARPMTSRYNSICHTCKKSIKKGEEIIYWPSGKVAGHYDCDKADYEHSLASFEDEETMNRGFIGGKYEHDPY